MFAFVLFHESLAFGENSLGLGIEVDTKAANFAAQWEQHASGGEKPKADYRYCYEPHGLPSFFVRLGQFSTTLNEMSVARLASVMPAV